NLAQGGRDTGHRYSTIGGHGTPVAGDIVRPTRTQFAKERDVIAVVVDVNRVARLLEANGAAARAPQALRLINVVTEDTHRAVHEDVPSAADAVVGRPAQLRTNQVVVNVDVVAQVPHAGRHRLVIS